MVYSSGTTGTVSRAPSVVTISVATQPARPSGRQQICHQSPAAFRPTMLNVCPFTATANGGYLVLGSRRTLRYFTLTIALAGDIGEPDTAEGGNVSAGVRADVARGDRIAVVGTRVGVGAEVAVAARNVVAGSAAAAASVAPGIIVAGAECVGLSTGPTAVAAVVNTLSAAWPTRFTVCPAGTKRPMLGTASAISRSNTSPAAPTMIPRRAASAGDCPS